MNLRADQQTFQDLVGTNVTQFAGNDLVKKLKNGTFSITDYHNILVMIFHQTRNAPVTFALAGENCPDSRTRIKEYLLSHAEEERDHWEWVLEDLASTGYKGPDPREQFPPFQCQVYVSFNNFLATKQPVARLGSAAMLEGIGAMHGKHSAQQIQKLLGLKPNQLKFYYGHGDTDVGHAKEIFDVLVESNLSPEEWGQLCNAVQISGRIYRSMYDEAAIGYS